MRKAEQRAAQDEGDATKKASEQASERAIALTGQMAPPSSKFQNPPGCLVFLLALQQRGNGVFMGAEEF